MTRLHAWRLWRWLRRSCKLDIHLERPEWDGQCWCKNQPVSLFDVNVDWL